jgi:hypothetical protein
MSDGFWFWLIIAIAAAIGTMSFIAGLHIASQPREIHIHIIQDQKD